MRTKILGDFNGASLPAHFSHSESPPETPETAAEAKFPMKVRFRGVVVTIYRKTAKYPFYRIAYRGDGGRVVRNFTTLAAAKKAAEAKARELHAGNHVGASLPKAAAHAYKFVTGKLAALSRDLTAAGDPATFQNCSLTVSAL